MMISHCDINPALGTNWFTEKDGKVFLFKIQGNHFRGCRENFEIITYFLKYHHKDDVQEILAVEFIRLISIGVVKPNWNSQGSLFDEIDN